MLVYAFRHVSNKTQIFNLMDGLFSVCLSGEVKEER